MFYNNILIGVNIERYSKASYSNIPFDLTSEY